MALRCGLLGVAVVARLRATEPATVPTVGAEAA
jgi:hypothetical protein